MPMPTNGTTNVRSSTLEKSCGWPGTKKVESIDEATDQAA